MQYGEVYLSDDRCGCALIVLPDKKKLNLWQDLQLLFRVMGLGNLSRAWQREKKISAMHPGQLLYYLWFIGVENAAQGNGTGSRLLEEVILRGQSLSRTICLETSTLRNITWYQKHGFQVYGELDLGYRLYFLKRV
jgi:ribosomal protein S18 acetylase RimI-like enzyme